MAEGIPLDDIAEYLNLTALFRNQWGFRPEDGENDTEFKDRVKATLREQLGKAKEADLLVPSVAYGHFAANAEGNDLVIWKDESRTSEWMRFTFPRQRKEPWLCIADFFRPVDSGEEDFASFMLVHHRAPGPRRRRPACSPRTTTRTTSSCTGSASRWPRRRPSTGTAASARSSGSPTRTARP